VGLLERIAAARGRQESRYSIDQWLNQYLIPSQVQFGGNGYSFGLNQTLAGQRIQAVANTLPGYAAALRACPPAFAAQMVRALVLSQARFAFRNRPSTRTPRRLFGTTELGVLERPWPNATTGELLALMEWHAGLAGNAFILRQPSRLRALRPDWCAVVYGSDQEPDDAATALDGEIIGYVYQNGGIGSGRGKPQTILPQDMAHWSPLPDPERPGMGQSWVSAALADIQGDRAATQHKLMFFSNGAPQPLDARVLTPAGWSTMGEMRVGAQVIGSDGKARDVVAVYPQGERDIYRVTFSSGAQVECTEDHLWSVASIYDRRMGITRTMPLSQIVADGITYPSGPAKWSVPLVAPVEFDDPGPLPVDSYLLGSLLGNAKGHGAATLACHTEDVDEQERMLAPLLPGGTRMVRRDRDGQASEISFAGPGAPRPNPLRAALADLGLWGLVCHEKFIPERYMRASVTDRVALLQGLIDTDGSVDARQPNTVRFDNVSERLCRQLAELVGALGGIATVRPGRSAAPGRQEQWRVSISRLPEWINPCRLARKAGRYRPTLRGGAYRYIRSVEFVGRKQAQCIGVDSADHLYVTDDYVLTHNTPNMVVSGVTAATREQFDEIVDAMDEKHSGLANAYRTLYLAAGADAKVVGADLKQLDFKATQGAGETRIAMLGRVPAPLLQISEGLAGSSLNAGNFGMARRIFADSWIYPTLQDLCSAMATIVRVPSDAELWFDTTDMPLLREDAKDAAEITQVQATTIGQLVREGFTSESAKASVIANDMSLLVHSGLVSVQLQVPGSDPTTVPPGGSP